MESLILEKLVIQEVTQDLSQVAHQLAKNQRDGLVFLEIQVPALLLVEME
jgi:hypothetical protein